MSQSDAQGDVPHYADAVPDQRRQRGEYHHIPRPLPARQSAFATPTLPTPRIERPVDWPATRQPREVIIEAAGHLGRRVTAKAITRRRSVLARVLDWLEQFPGANWQQRWLASGADGTAERWTDLVSIPAFTNARNRRAALSGAGTSLAVLDVVRPSYNWLYRWHSTKLAVYIAEHRDPTGFATIGRLCDETPRLTRLDRGLANMQLARILIHNGGQLADITLADCIEAYRAQIGYTMRQHSHWYLLLIQAGFLSADSPPTLAAANRRGQLTVEELVDGYGVVCRPVRDLLVDFLRDRQPSLDYCPLRGLTIKLVLLFWRDMELHNPGIDSLNLPVATARAWKERLQHIRYGKRRVGERRRDPNNILITVRSFYADLNQWALEDPARWGRWAAANPITARDLAGQHKQIKHTQARMHQRTRELAPILPALVAAASKRRHQTREALNLADAADPGDAILVDGQRLIRSHIVTHPANGRTGRPGLVYADDPVTGLRRNLTLEEDNAFWAWAIIEVLRHTGVRIEELLELTHRSFVAYTLPRTGEVIPLLQITPSKTDRERLLVVSPELATVLSTIITRASEDTGRVPLVTRYDPAEKLHSPAMPFLLQRRWGIRNVALTKIRVKHLLDTTTAATSLTAPDGTPVVITPHDFRRIFATEAVGSGLPIHIAAKLLGHESITTTQRYVAVYDQEVIDHHRAFIARRRALRPSEEYREPTSAEWDEFLAHFEKRKVELGICGRAYGTPCVHEHACLRCPMLRPDPNQLARLQEIQANLIARKAEARQRGWLGEIEGLDISLAGAEQKLAAMRSASPIPITPLPVRPT